MSSWDEDNIAAMRQNILTIMYVPGELSTTTNFFEKVCLSYFL